MPDGHSPFRRSFLRRHGPSIAAASIGVVVSLALWQIARTTNRDAVHRVVATEAEIVLAQLDSRLRTREEALHRMRQRWRVQARSHEAEWRSDARLYHDDYAGMQGFAWVDAGGEVRWVEPDTVRSAFGRVLSTPEVRRAIDRLEATRSVQVTRPRPGTAQVTKLYPLSAGDRPDGFVALLVDHETMLDSILAPPVAEGYAVTVRDGSHEHDVRSGGVAGGDPFAHAVSRAVDGRTWDVSIAPLPVTVDTIESPLDEVVLVFGLIGSALLALAIALARRARERERALRETESMMERINENLPVLVAVHSADLSEIVYLNREFETIYGRSVESVLEDPHSFLELVHPDDRDRIARAMERDLPGGDFEEGYRVLRSDGEVRWVEAWSSAVGERGVPTGYVVTVAQDVTERKQDHRALKETADRLREITENMPVVVTITDPDGSTPHYVSPTYEAIYGRPVEDVFENPASFLDVIHPEDRDRVAEVRRRDYSTGDYDVEYRILRGGEVRWIHAWSAAVRDEGGETRRVVTLAEDVTRRKRTEVELRRSNEDLQQFAYIASHDLQEPLRMVTSYLQLIERRYGDRLDEKGHRFLNFAVDGAERMKRLINGLLQFSRVHTHGERLSRIDVDEIVDEALANLESPIRESGATIRRGDLPVVVADAAQLGLVFQNLVSNAIKFRNDRSPEIEIEATERPEAWVFRVSDDGVGFDPALADQMFVLFRRLHGREEYPGTGIGLALCRRVVERHGGRIWADSEVGSGSTFFFTLPKRPEVRST